MYFTVDWESYVRTELYLSYFFKLMQFTSSTEKIFLYITVHVECLQPSSSVPVVRMLYDKVLYIGGI